MGECQVYADGDEKQDNGLYDHVGSIPLKGQVPFQWETANMIIEPVVLLLISIGIYLAFSHVMTSLDRLPLCIETSGHIVFLSICYIGLLLLFHKMKPLP